MNRFLLLALMSMFLVLGNAQSTGDLWADIPSPQLSQFGQKRINAKASRSLTLNASLLSELLEDAPMENSIQAKNEPLILEFPLPNGKMERFSVVESPIMAAGLGQRYPTIKTYSGKSLDNGRSFLRFDQTQKGFHAMILAGEQSWFIDPYYNTNIGQYISYYKKDFQTDQTFECLVEDTHLTMDEEEKNLGPNPVGEELRTYRLAITATGEYTQFHGGTVADGMAALVTLMNRVNGVYERDISVRMLLIENNDTIIFTDPDSDPFPDGPALGTNQQVIDQYIGSANYDIGHVVGAGGGGGVAALRSVCNIDRKARGLTSLGQPIGDPFAIDYVAHEIGHQFGGNHTFNGSAGSCNGNRASSRAFEPGSGTSIMAYAGICGAHNTQAFSDDHFHVGSFDEMAIFTLSGGGNTCAEVIPTDNTPPVVEAGPSGYIIPMSTPFELTGSATDLEGDSLTFCWEQYDLGPAGSPNAPQGNAPLFRTFSPKNDSTRVFPRLDRLVANANSLGEYLPDYARDMRFRCTVRDNHGFGGGVDWDEMTFSVTDLAGPFRVTSQNNGAIWTSGTYEEVTWEVANTNAYPINTNFVNIYLSIDGGFTYPITLAENLVNNGKANVLVPVGLEESNCRVKVKGSGNIFFDINNTNFEIQAPISADFSLGISPTLQTICQGEDAFYSLSTSGVLDYSGVLNLNLLTDISGLSITVDSTNLQPPSTSDISITGTENLGSGTYNIELEVSDAERTEIIEFVLEIVGAVTEAVNLTSPENGAINISTFTEFSWEPTTNARYYTFELSSQPDFSDILFSESYIEDTSLEFTDQLVDSTTYYWRVKGFNQICNEGPSSEIYSYTTEVHRCETFFSEDLPKPYTSFPFINSRIIIEEDLSIRDVDILNVRGTQNIEPMNDEEEPLRLEIRGPNNETIVLFPESCVNGVNYNISFDDEAVLPSSPCPYNTGLSYRPVEPLSTFDRMSAAANWRFLVFNGEEPGELTNWELRICYGADAVTSTSNLSEDVSEFKLFPNPANDWVSIEMNLESAQNARLEVRNALGQIIKQENWGQLNQGLHRFDMDMNEVPNGMYFFQLISDDQQLLGSSKLIKQ